MAKRLVLSRRNFLKAGLMAGAGLVVSGTGNVLYVSAAATGENKSVARRAFADPIPGGTLLPGGVPKFVTELIKPPAMPGKLNKNKDKYKIAVREFSQQILPDSLPETTVWSYGSVDHPGTVAEGGTFNYPAFTIEAKANKTVEVQWRNELVDAMGNSLPHLLPVDQTLHWANPPGGTANRDKRGFDPAPYLGPVPIVTHVHGAHTYEDSDGYPEAWYLPDANDIPAGYARTGTFFDYFDEKYGHNWSPGAATFKYPNDQPATTLWYHDHALGMTRLNVYAGPAGFWLIRGGSYDDETNLGYMAPGVGDDPLGEYTEIPIVIQDRSFHSDGSLFYPDNRAFFERTEDGDPLNVPPTEPYLDIPFIPDDACDGEPSDVSPIWNPEFFGNMMVVNGRTWPYLEVERRRYRFRFLNGCNSRFLVLKMTEWNNRRMDNNGYNPVDLTFWQIGGDQGFLPAPVEQNYLLMAPAERADVIVDFSGCEVGDEILLVNDGPDAPFGGITLEDLSDWESTGQVMKFVVKENTLGGDPDPGVDPDGLMLPVPPPLPEGSYRQVSLNEEESQTVRVDEDEYGNIVKDCEDGDPFGPTSALLGTYDPDAGISTPLTWGALITENPDLDATETWEIYNFTADAHPIHVHLVKFEVVNRQELGPLNEEGIAEPGAEPVDGTERLPEDWETGFKDTVIAYPAEVTRIRMKFDLEGFYVWHCHIVEHEDNEMMRPYHVGLIPGDAPAQ